MKDNYKELNIAKINWFDQSKGFGVVTDIFSHCQYFMHYRQCKMPDYSNLVEGEYIFVGEGHDSQRNKDIVTGISLIDSFDKWTFIKDQLPNQTSDELKDDYRKILCHIACKAISGSLKEDFHNGFVQLLINSEGKLEFNENYSIIYDSLKTDLKYNSSVFTKELEDIDITIVEHKTIEYADTIKEYHTFPLYMKLFYSYKYHKDFTRIIEYNFNIKGLPSFMADLKRLICNVNPDYTNMLSNNPSFMLDKNVYSKLKGKELLEQFKKIVHSNDKKEQDFYLIENGWLPQEDINYVIDKYDLTNFEIDNLIRSQYCNDFVKKILFDKKVDLFFETESFKSNYNSISLIEQAATIQYNAEDWIKHFLDRLTACDSLLAHNLKVELYKKDIVKDIDVDFIIYYIEEFHLHDLASLLDNYKIGITDKIRLVNAFYNKKAVQDNELQELLVLAKKELGASYDNWYTEKVVALTDAQKYNWWKAGLYDYFPAIYFEDVILGDREDNYNDLKEYLRSEKVPKSDAIDLLYKGLSKHQSFSNRYDFYKVFYHIKTLSEIDANFLERILAYNNPFFKVCLWFNQNIDEFDFNVLAKKFIYFNPKDQVKIIKRLFYLADLGKMTLTVKMLESLTRIDADLFAIISKEHPCIPIDISTEVIVQALSSISETGKFSIDKDVFEILFNSLQYTTKYIKISEYFDECCGRITLQRTADNTALGKITKKDNMFLVEIFTTITSRAYSHYYGPYERQVRNVRFEDMLQAIRNIDGRRWNKERDAWEVPVTSEEELYEFARNYSVEIEGDPNYHLRNFRENKDGQPYGIEFCEGRPAPDRDNYTNREFLWCRNGKCFHRQISTHSLNDYENYTLLDFCRILGVNTDSADCNHRVVRYGKYLTFSSMINRVNNILDHLYCRECGQMLVPSNLTNYHTHLVTNFHCDNPNCSQYRKNIYISKCFNWKCNGIIDKRDSKTCPNGWVICPKCGSCCSNRTVSQRIEHLRELNLPIPATLYDFIRLRAGHLEKREFFCSECGVQMERLDYDRFFCPQCRKILERRPYDFADNYVNRHQNSPQ